MERVNRCLAKVQRQVERPFYSCLLGLFACLDSLVFFIPTDGLLVTSVFAYPRAWFRNAIGTAVGSVLGSLIFAALIEVFGLSLLHTYLPGIESSAAWITGAKLMGEFGIYAIFLVALTPLPQPPIVVLAALGNVSLSTLGIMLFLGRLLKYVILARIVAKSPDFVSRLRGIQKEVAVAKELTGS